MQLFVKTITGSTITINIEYIDKVKDIKMAIQEKEGLPFEQQRIIFSGKCLADDKQISEYNIEPGSTLHMVLQLRGG